MKYLISLLTLCLSAAFAAPSVDFNRDVRPILSNKCWACHGPDGNHRKADLRLDTFTGATRDLGGYQAIVPGDPATSEAIVRILSKDKDEIMPPPESHKEMTPQEIDVLSRWIKNGAEYADAWTYVPPKKSPVPNTAEATNNWIDNFVFAKLEKEGLAPSPKADARTLIRRLTFDLTGLPPTPAEVDAFVADPSPKAYAATVNRLLASPAFGERLATYWLDLVRYADTVGYHGDQDHRASPYRDYVIAAFNANMPFDQFTREQLAGDLLPNPTLSQKVATAYNRLLQTSHEGGIQPKEYRAIYQADRVRNVSNVWMGATVGCAQCHDHKYDPYTAKDFYRMAAFFADVDDEQHFKKGTNSLPTKRPPEIKVGDSYCMITQAIEPRTVRVLPRGNWLDDTGEIVAPGIPEFMGTLQKSGAGDLHAQLDAVDREIAVLTAALDKSAPADLDAWRQAELSRRTAPDTWRTLATPIVAGTSSKTAFAIAPNGIIDVNGTPPPQETHRVRFAPAHKSIGAVALRLIPGPNGKIGHGNGNIVLNHLLLRHHRDGKTTDHKFASAKADYSQSNWPVPGALSPAKDNGWAVDGHKVFKAPRTAVFGLAEPLALAPNDQLELVLHYQSQHPLHHPQRFAVAVSPQPDAPVPGTDDTELLAILNTSAADWTPAQRQLALDTRNAASKHQLDALRRKQTQLQARTRLNRLDFANWLVANDDSGLLTARVQVNRLWYLMFGTGISKILDDFGGQGQPPTNPELLDNLAVAFVESGWDVKAMLKLLVTSRAYQQSSITPPKLRELDPNNQLVARQSRYRFPAEMVRDNALAVSGLLVDKLGGEPVKPYQPAAYYRHLNFPPRKYQQHNDDRQWRRGVYVHWQRQFLHPMMKAFDAPTREECSAERPRSNTPTAALVLLNDPTFVEAAKMLAVRLIQEADNPDARIQRAANLAWSRPPSPAESAVFHELLAADLERFRGSPEAAKALLETGLKPVPKDLNPIEVAAWTSVARAILATNETITRN